jgi:hypothetical protein
MSVTPFPDPRTTQYNPSAWDFTTYFKYLNSIVTFPRAQNAVIQFIGSVYLTTRTALTQWASTAYSTSEIVAWVTANVTPILGSAFTSAVLQYYFGGISVNTINPTTTGGTLLIGHGSATNNVEVAAVASRSVVLHLGDGNTSSGGIHLNNGTNATGNVEILNGIGSTGTLTLGSSTSTTHLHNPLTPLYDYPIGTATGLNTPSIGTAGTIGFIPATTFIGTAIADGSLGGGLSVRSVSLTAGTWVLYGFIRFSIGQTVNFAVGIMFSTVQSSSTGSIASKGTQRLGTVPANTCMGINTMGFVSPTTTTTYYLNGRATSGGANTAFSSIVAVRVV